MEDAKQITENFSRCFADTDPKWAIVTPEVVDKWSYWTDKLLDILSDQSSSDIQRQISLLALVEHISFSNGIYRNHQRSIDDYDFLGAHYADVQAGISDYLKEFFYEANSLR